MSSSPASANRWSSSIIKLMTAADKRITRCCSHFAYAFSFFSLFCVRFRAAHFSFCVSLLPFATERLYAAPAEIVALLSIFYGGISILAVIGNTLVIWVVATTRQMRTVTNMYIANLAFADVIIGLFSIPFQVSSR